MLRDTLAQPDAGHHVEQVEILFAPRITAADIAAAWRETVQQTAALQISFTSENGNPRGWDFVIPPTALESAECPTGSLESWFSTDQLRPLLTPGEVPWRAIFWPKTHRLVWTFHHALLDGRSIARVLQSFFSRLGGNRPEPLALPRWRPPPADAITQATELFSQTIPPATRFPPEESNLTPAVHHLGAAFRRQLESSATRLEVTVTALVTWAWGQTILAASGSDTAWIEQLRTGAPQPQTAGFTMNLLPVLIRAETSPQQFQSQLRGLRTIETVSPQDFPPGVFPDTNGPWASMIMAERGSLHHMAHAPNFIETLKLHERKGKSLAATAYILPDLRLEVEGPARHLLLAKWIDLLLKLST